MAQEINHQYCFLNYFFSFSSNAFTCAYICTNECSNFVNPPSNDDCKVIENDGQALVKTSPFNPKAVKVWSKEKIERGLFHKDLVKQN